MKILYFLAFWAACAFAQPSCTPDNGSASGVVKLCNVSFDATIPSGQTYSRTWAAIYYPFGMAASTTLEIVVIAPGRGWAGISENYAATNATGGVDGWARALVLDAVVPAGYVCSAKVRCAVYVPWSTWPVAYQVVAPHGIGDTSITVQTLNNANTAAGWFPNTTGCPENCVGYSTPFTMIYTGVQPNADQETITVTAQGSTANLTLTLNAITHNHGANEIVYLPKTNFPATVGDFQSALSWLGANAGAGTYPGNPNRIHFWTVSSDAYNAIMATRSAKNAFVGSCAIASWWGSSAGNNCGSSNSSTNYTVVNIAVTGVPWDMNWMYAQASAGPTGNYTDVQTVTVPLIGCVPSVDTGCTAYAAAASPNGIVGSTWHGNIQAITGIQDFTTPPCAINTQWGPTSGAHPGYTPNQGPCNSPNPNMYTVSGYPYAVFTNVGSGHGADCNLNYQVVTGFCWTWSLPAISGTPQSPSAGAITTR